MLPKTNQYKSLFKKGYFYFFISILFITCSESDDNSIPDNAVFEPQTELISLIKNENQLTLTWKPVIIDEFKSYKVYRYASYTDEFNSPNTVINLGELVAEITNNLTTQFTDNEIPFNSFINYAIVTEYYGFNDSIERMTSLNYLSYENENLSFSLLSLEKQSDGGLKLIWEKDENENFENYTIHVLNQNYTTYNEGIFNNGEVLAIHYNQENTNSIDETQYSDGIVFYVVSKKINGKTILSKNFLSIDNPRNLNFKPSQTLKNPYNENEIIIINNNGEEVIFYNINTLSREKINIDGKIFFCSIGKFNGVSDLYVPSENGKVYVIDLNSYQIKETIDLNTDYNIISAIAINDHILFLEKHYVNPVTIGGMFVYNRASNTVLNREGSYTMHANSKLIFAKENYFFFVIWDGLGFQNTSAINRLNINGNVVSTDFSFNESRIDSKLFALSNDQSYFVSSNFGFQSTIDYQNITEVTTGSYSENSIFGDVKIKENDNIYFTVPDLNQINVFEKNNFNSIINQYTTTGKPLFLEVFDSQLISVNQIENSYYIETIFN